MKGLINFVHSAFFQVEEDMLVPNNSANCYDFRTSEEGNHLDF